MRSTPMSSPMPRADTRPTPMRLRSQRAVFVLLLLMSVCTPPMSPVLASSGDVDPEFRRCVSNRCSQQCSVDDRNTYLRRREHGLLLSDLSQLIWTCMDECDYACQHTVTDEREQRGLAVLQYHGKWPMTRVAGMQEPLSTVFSVLNAVPHALHLTSRREMYAPAGHPLRRVRLGVAAIGVNTWVWSTAFHARDCPLTERLDYHFATLLVVAYCWLACARLVQQLGSIAAATRHHHSMHLTRLSMWCGVLFLLAWLRHVWYLNTVTFDYGYNMVFTGAFFVAQAVVWMAWAWLARKSHPTAARKAIVFQVLLVCAATFELWDFSPVLRRSLDAHAVWHGLTIPLGFLWYDMLMSDGTQHNKQPRFEV